jgi:hypothetical protein
LVSIKIADLIKTFLEGDLVPAVILWQAGRDVFVIDGAHRLSALIAWVQNDYGNGSRSIKHFQGLIPYDQKRAAEDARKIIESTIGTYVAHVAALQHPEHAAAEVREWAKILGILAVPIQWVPGGDAKRAEESFYKINEKFTAINPTEIRILKSRKSPNAIAARAIVRSGTGHRYWHHFDEVQQKDIEKLAREIYGALYDPPLRTPNRTAGRSASR